jgi:hypothetical protein
MSAIALSRVPPFAFDRTWEFDVAPHELWAVLSDTSAFSGWWPWLRSFDPIPLESGRSTRCAIGPPLPYLLRVNITITAVQPAESLDAVVSGDVRGPARLELAPSGAGTEARMSWELEVRRRLLRHAATVARPMLQWGHDWVVDRGVEQFRRVALAARDGQL